MHDTPPPIPEDPTAQAPFGAGIPAERVEPVRLSPGERRGPALDVRGHSAPRSYPHQQAGRAPEAPSFANAPRSDPAAGFAASAAVGATLTGSAGAEHAGYSQASAGTPPPQAPPTGTPPPASAHAAPAAKPAGRWWIGLAHIAFLVPFPAGVIITAALWIWRRDRDPLMADQGREALNMQLTFWLVLSILGVSCLGQPLVPFVYVLGAVLCILAAIAAANGDKHRYPWVFRFLV